jgi:pantoate kinase
MGDAVAQSLGGFVHRLKPGIPPHGVVERPFKGNEDVVVCLLGHPPSTADILNSDMKENITRVGDEQLRKFSGKNNLGMMIACSWAFARDSGLATPPMEEALSTIVGIGQGSPVMLGNAIFAFGDTGRLEERLRPFGEVIITKVSEIGATSLA